MFSKLHRIEEQILTNGLAKSEGVTDGDAAGFAGGPMEGDQAMFPEDDKLDDERNDAGMDSNHYPAANAQRGYRLGNTAKLAMQTSKLPKRYRSHQLLAAEKFLEPPATMGSKRNMNKVTQAIIAASRFQQQQHSGNLFVISSTGDMYMLPEGQEQAVGPDIAAASAALKMANKMMKQQSSRHEQDYLRSNSELSLNDEAIELAPSAPLIGSRQEMSRAVKVVAAANQSFRDRQNNTIDSSDMVKRDAPNGQEMSKAARTLVAAKRIKSSSTRTDEHLVDEEEMSVDSSKQRKSIQQIVQVIYDMQRMQRSQKKGSTNNSRSQELERNDMEDYLDQLGPGDEGAYIDYDPHADKAARRSAKASMLKSRMKYQPASEQVSSEPRAPSGQKGFQAYRQAKRRELYTPSLPAEARSEGPGIQIVFKNVDGKVASTQELTEEEQGRQQSQQQQQVSSSSAGGTQRQLEPTTNVSPSPMLQYALRSSRMLINHACIVIV